jgi:hypothetical protein
MNKAIIIIILTFTIYSCKSQDMIYFKVGFLPDIDYTFNLTQVYETNKIRNGSEEVLNRLKRIGIENPSNTIDTIKVKCISKTGKLYQNMFSIDIEILESTNPILESGVKVYANSIDGKVSIDSISASKKIEEEWKNLIPKVESALNLLEYPNRNIKLGDHFEQNSTTSIPLYEMIAEIDIQSIYTLTKVVDGIGYFDVKQIYQFESTLNDNKLEMTGHGKGKLNYNIEKQIPTKFYLETEIKLYEKNEYFNMETTIKSVKDQTIEVNKASR